MEKKLAKLLDRIAEGIVYLDHDLNITYANIPFMKMMGITSNQGPGHPAGIIKPGDLVLVACNYVDFEDDVLMKEDLSCIGVDIRNIEKGDGVLAVGALGAPAGSAAVKLARYMASDFIVDLTCGITKDKEASLQINEINNILTIAVGQCHLEMRYQTHNAMLVILDRDTKEIIFYQDRGYTLRNESFGDIMRGKDWASKGQFYDPLSYKGKNFMDFFPDRKCLRAIRSVVNKEQDCVENIEVQVSLVYFLATVNSDGEDGVVLIFNDLTEVKQYQAILQENEKYEQAFSSIIGSSKLLQSTVRMAAKISQSKSTVLLLGESGTGKGIFAKAIHDNSSRSDKNFVAINMAAIPPALLESELFGYEAGSFTGASGKGKIGRFMSAHGGTIFLDEIGDMNLELQAKILQVLQENRVYPVGSVSPVDIDVRIIAATHQNLEEQVRTGKFRADLYYRLNVITLELAPLREHKEDIWNLVEYFLPIISKKVGKIVRQIDEDVKYIFYFYDWPGNVRELENVLESAVNMAESQTITLEDLPKRFLNFLGKRFQERSMLPLREASGQAEKESITAALELTKGNKAEAAKVLNIARTTFYNKLKKHSLIE